MSKSGGLYIHIPYCRHKCLYCDFFAGGVSIAKWELLSNAILTELKSRAGELPETLNTIYIGGGTPSLMPPHLLNPIVEYLHENRDLSAMQEFTIEINPEDVDYSKIDQWKRLGVNRVSLGVQSLDDAELFFLKREHTSLGTLNAASILRENFDNMSMDLIFGIPGQSIQTLGNTISAMLYINPNHISAYSLTYEPGTALTALRDAGRIKEISEESSLEMFAFISSRLKQEGYKQYEISNYAKPGFESKHNSAYWNGKPYLGIGPSACSYNGRNLRRNNPSRLNEYLDFFGDNLQNQKRLITPFYEEEILTAEEMKEEYIMLSLRTAKGIYIPEFKEKFGIKAMEILLNKASVNICNRNLTLTDNRLSLTKKGIMTSDTIILSLI